MLKALRSEKEAGDLLATYLLQGWIMTDQICSVQGCPFPLMKSKDGSHSFCTHHDTLPNSSAKDSYKPKPIIIEEVKAEVNPDMSDELQIRRQRREQSSKASQLIGQKMLQRWAILNEHCPNESCYAVPLVRNPDTKQMYCVICENIILTEEEAAEIENKKKAQKTKEALQLENEKKEQSRKEQMKKEQEKRELEAKAASASSSSISTQEEEPKKRQKTSARENERKYEVSDYFSSESVVSILSTKMNELTERVKECNDPRELGALFKSIKSCAGAIQACVEAGQACDKILLQ